MISYDQVRSEGSDLGIHVSHLQVRNERPELGIIISHLQERSPNWESLFLIHKVRNEFLMANFHSHTLKSEKKTGEKYFFALIISQLGKMSK